MAKRQKITQYRERLDRTLASPKLTNEESLRSLVENQILHSSGKETKGCGEKVIQKRTLEVSNFLDMLRSVSEKSNDDDSKAREATTMTSSQPEWKVKQDNEEFRVMYREGPVGSPLHTLLVEGYVDGPLDICLCISWESALYGKWWPQSTIPTFKILTCKCLQEVRSGEQISLVRMKVSWPLSTREAIVHYFLFEYFEDDLLVVLLNTVSDSESIDVSTHGFSNEAIPEANDVVRIDLVGGFALQKVTPERSYFRTIANMDIKLDFVPPAFINFVSRQLIGNGFRLYQKAVTSRFTTDKDFSNALKGSLYARIRKALYSTNQSNGCLEEKVTKESEATEELVVDVPEEQHETTNGLDDNSKAETDDNAVESSVEARKIVCEIEEIKSNEESKRFEDDRALPEKVMEISRVSRKSNSTISWEVEQALGTLEKVISIVRKYGISAGQLRSLKDGNAADEDSKSLELRVDSSLRQEGLNSTLKEINYNNKIGPASIPSETDIKDQVNFSPAITKTSISYQNTRNSECLNSNSKPNGVHESGPNGGLNPGKEKRHRLCCFGMIS